VGHEHHESGINISRPQSVLHSYYITLCGSASMSDEAIEEILLESLDTL